MKPLAVLVLLPLVSFAAAPATDWSPNATGTVAWHTNASNGAAVWDRVGTLGVHADGIATSGYEVTKMDDVHLTAHLGGDWYPRFRKLSRGLVGGRLDWRHTFGASEFAPVFTVEGAGDLIKAWQSARSGTLAAATVKLAKRFQGGWHVGVSERFERLYARGSVFDSSSDEAALEIARDVGEATRVTLTGRWRKGDVVTYAQYNRPDLVALAREYAVMSTFGYPSTVYSTDARTVAGKLALVHATAPDTALIVGYEYAMTRRSGLRFANSVISVSFVRQY